jgi:diguanylate cyclase (GGDEF)-like protein/PAS domain S-box-containing protein
MNGIALSVFGALTATVVTILVYGLIYVQTHDKFMGIWALAWSVGFTGLAAFLTSLFYQELKLLIFLYEISMYTTSLLLLWGTHEFLGKKMSVKWVYGAAASVFWVVAGTLASAPFLVVYIPANSYLVSMLIANGVLFLHSKKKSDLGRALAGWGFIIWGIFRFNYIYFHPVVPSFTPWAFMIATALTQSVAVGTLMQYLAHKEDDLINSEAKYRELANLLPEAVFETDHNGFFTFANFNAYKLFGYSDWEFAAGMEITQLIIENERDKARDYLNSLSEGELVRTAEFTAQRKDGGTFTVKLHASAIVSEKGVTGFRGIIRDITDRKEEEQKLKQLGFCDTLTGLYNRTYFEQEVVRLEDSSHISVSIIVCDLDVLKLINDTLGHSMGDELLVYAAGIIKSAFRDTDIVCRIGGDEFAVIVLDAPQDTAENAYYRIKESVDRHNRVNPGLPLSISVGFATSYQADKKLTDLFQVADDNMYREKLQKQQFAKHCIVEAFMKALEEKNFYMGNHMEHLNKLITLFSRKMNFSEEHTAKMKLLARYHDIGKVGVPDRILSSTGPLSATDRAEINRHCEIGSRIAQAAPELEGIADWILKHHEWWNGEGYPLGLKGDEIPMESRILALCDAYDELVRSGEMKLPPQQVLEQIEQRAGTQFDPNMVKLLGQLLG